MSEGQDMDRQDLFDVLTIRLSDVTRRRDVLLLLGKLGLAMVVFGVYPWRVVAQGVTGDSQLVKGCKLPGQQCSGKSNCCANKCTSKHRCGCVGKGHEPNVDTPLGPTPVKALCCSNKLNKRKGTCK
jgi:hypothetical protein